SPLCPQMRRRPPPSRAVSRCRHGPTIRRALRGRALSEGDNGLGRKNIGIVADQKHYERPMGKDKRPSCPPGSGPPPMQFHILLLARAKIYFSFSCNVTR